MTASPPPPLALTLGEPAGVGPEIVAAAWRALKDGPQTFAVIGDADLLRRQGVPVQEIAAPAEAPAAFARALPVLQAMGRRITHVGASGAGQIAKSANQVIVGLTIGAVAEALALARAAGADPAKVREAIRGGFAESRILDLHGGRMVNGDFTPGGRVTTQVKDLRQAEELAQQSGIDLPTLGLSLELFELLVEQGDGALDHSALYRLFAR